MKKLKMAVIMLLIMSMFLNTTAFAMVNETTTESNLEGYTTILNVPCDNLVGSKYEEKEEGPQSFYVENESKIYICDTVNRQIIMYKNEKKEQIL